MQSAVLWIKFMGICADHAEIVITAETGTQRNHCSDYPENKPLLPVNAYDKWDGEKWMTELGTTRCRDYRKHSASR